MKSSRLNYTEVAKSFALRFPFLTTIVTQINFWILSYILFGLVTFFNTLINNELFNQEVPIELSDALLIATITGLLYGLILGILDYFTDRYIEKLPLGLEVIVKATLYLSSFSLIWFIGSGIFQTILDDTGSVLKDENLRFWTWGLFIYTLCFDFLVSFIRQVNRSFGPGVLVPVLFGRYRQPIIQNRIFLFIDLRSSTRFAEKLDPILYSELIQDCINQANYLVPRFNAQVYQYVGDEIVLTWTADNPSDYFNALGFFQSFVKRIDEMKSYYESRFGLMPRFKAGLHVGSVVTAEVGTIKRDIAYHGDAVNTTARLESKCSSFGVQILISEDFVNKIGEESKRLFEYVDEVKLKGKSVKVKTHTLTGLNVNRQ